MRNVNVIVIHCSDTPATMDIGVNEIRRWHLERGFADVGYHYIIRRSGIVERGRNEDVVGAHVEGRNQDSIGVCFVGGKPDCNFTRQQWEALSRLVENLIDRYPAAVVLGHRDLNTGKRCPCFDVKYWWNHG